MPYILNHYPIDSWITYIGRHNDAGTEDETRENPPPGLVDCRSPTGELRKHETEQERLLAEKGEDVPGVQLGQRIAGVDIEDRQLALAIAHHFLDRFAEEAAGRMSLEVHLHPPLRDVADENAFRVTDEVVERARKLGVEGDVGQQVKRMARDGTPYTHRKANLRHGRFILKVEGNDVVWIGLADRPPRPHKTK